jgi:hypothetical protein
MKRLFAFSLIFLIVLSGFKTQEIDRKTFYKALSGGEEASIDNMLEKLEHEKASSRVNAYKGALIMKKAGYVKGVGGKVKTFKKGAHLLEDEIKGYPSNTEFRFLRLTVQEHAPKILKYNKELDDDKQAIIAGYSKLDPDLKEVITGYVKDSEILKQSDLK